ncbi:MAG: DNA methyltransferase [Candidatus Contendobacter sp.]
MKSALDVERVTKRFFRDYDAQRLVFVELIQGIPDERDRCWYASVLMNRLMFVWFLQRRHFLDGGNANYLSDKLKDSQRRGENRFYAEFLQALFFEGFAKPAAQRSDDAQRLIGDIPYLNGGLFIPHRLERDHGSAIRVPDAAFESLFGLFAAYSWNLNDAPGGLDNEINPDVLGYIFEKYINQKAFGAYYTRTEITEYLCERTIHRLILARVNTENPFDLPIVSARKFQSLADLLLGLDASLCRELLDRILPELKLLDPACGSGAFLVAAMKTLINIYSAVIGRIKFLNDKWLNERLRKWESDHKSLAYFIKRTIITDNLFGVDLMEEATEIAKLRLFLALVASAQTVDELEPLPNIDFNILAGNSLIGLLRVDAHEFDSRQDDLFRKSYRQVLDEKNRKIETYRHTVSWAGGMDLSALKTDIEEHKAKAQTTLNDLLLEQWDRAGIKFEEATLPSYSPLPSGEGPGVREKGGEAKAGKPKKRQLNLADIAALHPFHWGFEFDEILNQRGGFDAIITNPPWEIFKPQAKEFFQEHSNLVSKNKMTIKEFEKEQAKLLKNPDIRAAWLEYLSRFPHVSAWFRAAPQFKHQSAIVNGKKTGSDINLYKLFTEQCYNLLREGGECGIVIPSGIYTDLGTKGLRDMLFSHCMVTDLVSFSNERYIFEEVHHAVKFCLLVFERGGETNRFDAVFRINPREAVAPTELDGFLHSTINRIQIPVTLVHKLSPDSYSIREFRSDLDIIVAEKTLKFPLLGEEIEGLWNLKLWNEFHMTNDSHLYQINYSEGRLPLWEGKQFYQYIADFGQPRYWLDEKEARTELLNIKLKKAKKIMRDAGLNGEQDTRLLRLDYVSYRLAFRDVTASTNERTVIAAILPPKRFCPHTVSLEQVFFEHIENHQVASVTGLSQQERLYLLAVFNSYLFDWLLRQSVTAHVSFFFIYNTPVPRLAKSDPGFAPIVTRAARLTCTTPEFDDLAKAIGLAPHPNPLPKGEGVHYGATDPIERARLRAELDGLIAHLYGLTEAEFAHILDTFPLVAEPVKIAALNAYRDVERGLIR